MKKQLLILTLLVSGVNVLGMNYVVTFGKEIPKYTVMQNGTPKFVGKLPGNQYSAEFIEFCINFSLNPAAAATKALYKLSGAGFDSLSEKYNNNLTSLLKSTRDVVFLPTTIENMINENVENDYLAGGISTIGFMATTYFLIALTKNLTHKKIKGYASKVPLYGSKSPLYTHILTTKSPVMTFVENTEAYKNYLANI